MKHQALDLYLICISTSKCKQVITHAFKCEHLYSYFLYVSGLQV